MTSIFTILISIAITIITVSIFLYYNEKIKTKYLESFEKENFRKELHLIGEKIISCLGEKNVVYYENLEKINGYKEILDCAIPEDFDYNVTIIQFQKNVTSSPQKFGGCGWAWIVNSGSGKLQSSVSLVIADGKELRRHYTHHNKAGNPSRTAVDYEGNIWIGNRGDSYLVKIYFDKNKCKGVTSEDKNNDGRIDENEMIDFDKDGCIAFKVDLRCNNVRAVCIDVDKKSVYAGCWDGRKFFKISENGKIERYWNLPANPYGCVVDDNGIVWISTLSNRLIRLNPKNNEIKVIQVPFTYGIWKCRNKDCIAFTTWDRGTVVLFNTTTEKIIWERKVGPQARGVFIDEETNVYAVSSSTNKIVKYDEKGILRASAITCGIPTGVSQDACGDLWVACMDGGIKIFDKSLNELNSFIIPTYHYQYSDFTGFQAGTEVEVGISKVIEVVVNERKWEFGVNERGPKIDLKETISLPVAIKYNETFIADGMLIISGYKGFLENFYSFLKKLCNSDITEVNKLFEFKYKTFIKKENNRFKLCSEDSCKELSCKYEIEEATFEKGKYIVTTKVKDYKISFYRNY
jgi:sugar lactone lactonase YvrE